MRAFDAGEMREIIAKAGSSDHQEALPADTGALISSTKRPAGPRPPRSRISSDVLGVPLPRAGEVEAADERRVVGHDDLRVHGVVHRARATTGRRLAAERRSLEDAPQERDLPLADSVRPPLAEDLVDLRVVDDAGQVAALLVHDLDEGAEYRPRGQHRRRDANALARLPDVLRDAVGERLAVLRAEPRPDARAVDLLGARVDIPRVLDGAALPELSERERVRIRDLAARRS